MLLNEVNPLQLEVLASEGAVAESRRDHCGAC